MPPDFRGFYFIGGGCWFCGSGVGGSASSWMECWESVTQQPFFNAGLSKEIAAQSSHWWFRSVFWVSLPQRAATNATIRLVCREISNYNWCEILSNIIDDLEDSAAPALGWQD